MQKKQIGVIPSGGNIHSLLAALQRCGHASRVLETPGEVQGVEHLVLPGQGRFRTVMDSLRSHGWDRALQDWFAADKPLLGICVGLQVLFEGSEEDPDCAGLGLLPGRVQKLQSPKQPMMGWSRVEFPGGEAPEGDAYFVNSFCIRDSEAGIGFADYGQRFCAVVQARRWIACQFHPEKSGAYGARLLQQWLS